MSAIGDMNRVLAVALLVVAPVTVAAQADTGRTTTLVVAVAGADGAPLEGVNLAISRSSVGAIMARRTNASGIALFTVVASKERHEILARSPGWAPAGQVIEFSEGDTIRVTLRLRPAPTALPPMRIEATRSNYLVDAAQIAASRRPVRDALEVLQKLRPSMLHDGDRCKWEPVQNVWINGRRVLFMASNVPILGGRSSRTIGTARVRTIGGRASAEPPAVDSVLASIRAEHVESIRLVNCWDTSLPGVGANNALYVSLKPGVDWDWKRGSFVLK